MSRIRFVSAPRKNPALLMRNPVFKSLHCDPMQEAKQNELAIAARLAFDAIQRGKGQAHDRDALACVVNICMVLAEWHCSADDLAAVLAAQEGMLRADGRVLLGKRWNFDAEGRAAMLAALDIHEQLIAQLGQSVVTDALMEIMGRRADGKVHKV